MNVVPKEKLSEMGALHLKTNEYLDRLAKLDSALITTSGFQDDNYYLVKISYNCTVKRHTERRYETGIGASFCEAVKKLHDRVFEVKEEEPKQQDNSVDARLTRIEDALETLANKIKE